MKNPVCRHCGAPVDSFEKLSCGMNPPSISFRLKCNWCGAAGPSSDDGYPGEEEKLKAQAVKAFERQDVVVVGREFLYPHGELEICEGFHNCKDFDCPHRVPHERSGHCEVATKPNCDFDCFPIYFRSTTRLR